MSEHVRQLLRGWAAELDGMYEAALAADGRKRRAILDRAQELEARDMQLRRAAREDLGR